MTFLKSPVGIIKSIALGMSIVLLALAILARPGRLYQGNYGANGSQAMNDFFQMSVILCTFSLISVLGSAIGSMKNKSVELADAGGHLLVAIFIVMYTAAAMDLSLYRYNESVDECDEDETPQILSKFGPKVTSEEEDVLKCSTDNPGNLHDSCMCVVKIVSKYNLTVASYTFGMISGFLHIAVGLVGLRSVKTGA